VSRQQRRAEARKAPAKPQTQNLASAAVQPLFDNAITHHQAGRLADAERLYTQILTTNPRHADALHLLGVLACQTGRPAFAAEKISAAIRLNGRIAFYHSNLSNALRQLGRFDEAVEACRQAAHLEPGFSQAHANLGAALFEAGRIDEAITSYSTAIRLNPADAFAHASLGTALWTLGRFAESLAACQTAITLNPRDAIAHSSLGLALRGLGRSEEALIAFQSAITLDPGYAEAHGNLGGLLEIGFGRLAEAVTAYEKAISLKPEIAEFHFNLACAYLKTGAFEKGWEKFEWRWKTKQMSPAHRNFEKPLWNGDTGGGKTLFIHAEQGFGDSLQFSRYAPLAAQRGFRVILEVPKPLVSLLGTLPGIDQVIGQGDPLPPFDFHAPMMSLPRAFRTTLATIPGQTPYLHADGNAAASWRQRLSVIAGQNPKIGLLWAGNPRAHSAELAAIDRRRSIAPELLAPLFKIPGLKFFSLQKEGPAAPAEFPIIDFMGEMEDFADTAALIANLDLVIAVDTAVAHLAAALGKPVWLLNRFDSCWRWLSGRRDSPWYPSLRLYNQPRPGAWHPAVAEIASDLTRLSRGDL